MKDRIYSKSKRSFPYRIFEIGLGAIAVLYALLEPLPFSSFFQSSSSDTTTYQQRDVIVVPTSGGNELSSPRYVDVHTSHPGNSLVVVSDNNKNYGLSIHPWIPSIDTTKVKAVLREAFILLLLNNIGVPLIGRFRTKLIVGIRCFIPLQRRLRTMIVSQKVLMVQLRRFFPKTISATKVLRIVQVHVRRIWKVLLTWYSKTSASKIINRCKKYLHTFLHHDDDDKDHDHDNAEHDNENDNKKKHQSHLTYKP